MGGLCLRIEMLGLALAVIVVAVAQPATKPTAECAPPDKVCESERCIQDQAPRDCCEYVDCVGGFECAHGFFSGIAAQHNVTRDQLGECLFTAKPGEPEEDVKAQVENEDDGSACFPAAATVLTKNGGRRRMDELRTGDLVESGFEKWSAVHFFSHRDPQKFSRFVNIHHQYGTFSVSPGHYIYINGVAAPAARAQRGDILETARGQVRVADVSSSTQAGLYNPHTLSGELVVEGVRSTCYTETISPRVAHLLLAPVRALFRVGVGAGPLVMLESGAPHWMLALMRRASANSAKNLIY